MSAGHSDCGIRSLFGLDCAGASLAEPSASKTPEGISKEGKGIRKGKEGGGVLANALCLLPVASVAGNVVPRAGPCVVTLNIVVLSRSGMRGWWL
ncbi:hypothetical protein BY996DRAFT_6611083 [Phakopsora pachyrhizi]|nr:hypothetical protein BY996DRAFT_6611083 [Phakopsora pachyrhizi]